MSSLEITHLLPVPSSEGTDRFQGLVDVSATRQAEGLWHQKDGVWVNGTLHREDLTGYDLNPLMHDVDGVGEISLVGVRETHDGSNVRKHRLYTVKRAGFQHAVEITDPAVGETEFTLASMPGWTETIEGPVRQGLHAQLATEFPTARIISIGSNGTGATGSRYGWNERSLHGIEAMGQARLPLLKALSHADLPLFLELTSMGSVIGHRMAHYNFYADPADKLENLRGQVLLSPAIVDPKNIFRDMGIRFFPELAKDLMLEMALKTPPKEFKYLFNVARHYGLTRGDLVAIGNQVLGLLRGTPEEAYADVVAKLPTVVVAGEKDPLAQWRMHQRVQEKIPGQLELAKIKRRGHGLGMKSATAGAKVAKVVRPMVQKSLAA